MSKLGCGSRCSKNDGQQMKVRGKSKYKKILFLLDVLFDRFSIPCRCRLLGEK
jgi:hypothetical protein